MEKNSKNGKRKLKVSGREIDKAIQKATREALKMHKLARNPIAVWQDGKIVILKPEEISV